MLEVELISNQNNSNNPSYRRINQEVSNESNDTSNEQETTKP